MTKRAISDLEAVERAAAKAAAAVQRAVSGGGAAGGTGAGGGASGGTGGGVGIGSGLGSSPIARQARSLSDLDALQDRYAQRDYRRRVAYERRKIEEAERLASAAAGRQEQMITQGLTVAAAVGYKGLQLLVDGYEKVRNNALEAAEASEFTRQYEGTTPIAFEKGNITPEVAEQLKVQAGIRAARQGGDAGTSAEMAGILGQFGKVTSAEAGLSQLEAIRVGLVKGRGDDSPLTRQLLNVAGSLVGEGHTVPSLPEMAALIGVTSLSGGPGQAGNRANQLYRGLKIGLTKQTKVKGTDQAQGAYLKGLGIGEKDTLEETLDKVVPDLQKAKDAGRDLDAYLASKNFRAADQRRALIETFENYGPLKQRFKEAREAGLAQDVGIEEIRKNQAYIESTSGRNAVSDALNAAKDVTRGSKAERYKVLLQEAETSPEFQKEEEDQGRVGKDFLRGFVDDPFHAAERGRRNRLDARIAEGLKKKASSLGIDESEYSSLDPTGIIGPSGPHAMENFVNRVESLIEAKGGTSAVDTRPQLDEMNRTLKEIRDQFPGRKEAPAPLPSAPKAGAVRP